MAEVLSESLPELVVPVSKLKIKSIEQVIFLTSLGLNGKLHGPLLAALSSFASSLPNSVATFL